jgi:hypothetical protein
MNPSFLGKRGGVSYACEGFLGDRREECAYESFLGKRGGGVMHVRVF